MLSPRHASASIGPIVSSARSKPSMLQCRSETIPSFNRASARQPPCLLRGLFPRGRRAVADLGIPGAGEATVPGLLAREHVVVDRPFGARHLVEHLDAVAVGVAQVDAERDAVVGDAFYRLSLGLELPV